MSQELTPKNSTGVFVYANPTDDKDSPIYGALIQAIEANHDGDLGYEIEVRAQLSQDEAREAIKSWPDEGPTGLLTSTSGRARMLVTPWLKLYAGVMLRFLEQIEREVMQKLAQMPSLAIHINPKAPKS